MENIILPIKEVEKMNLEEKRTYYQNIYNFCLKQKYKNYSSSLSKKMITNLAPKLRNYELEIYGERNIPLYDSAIFLCNHSNSHEFFTIHEVFHILRRNVTPFGASDCLNPLALKLFRLGDVTLIDRASRESSLNGMLEFSKKIIDGKDGIIYGETTWNLHPILPMQPMKAGGTQVAMITEKIVIPTIFEYVEVNDVCLKEKELYKKCIVVFGKPVVVKREDNQIAKTKEIEQIMADMRRKLWRQLGIKRNSLDDINKEVYLNHTYLKKFDALGFTYDSEHEFQFMLNAQNGVENEYCLDEKGNFVPGITHKNRTLQLK